MDSQKILKISKVILLISIIIFNVLVLFDSVTTYMAMKADISFIEFNKIASNLFSAYGLTQGILIHFFVGLICSIIIYFVSIKSLEFLLIRIPLILGYIYMIINHLFVVASNVYYLIKY